MIILKIEIYLNHLMNFLGPSYILLQTLMHKANYLNHILYLVHIQGKSNPLYNYYYLLVLSFLVNFHVQQIHLPRGPLKKIK